MRYPFNGSFPVTQGFGVNPGVYAKFGLKGHNGLDFGLPSGTPVVAAHSGQMVTGFDAAGYGNYVFITGGGWESVYGHLQRFARPSGATVSEGEVIGFSNNTGFSSGPHLHFGVRPIPFDRGNGYAGYIDPTNMLKKGGSMPITAGQQDKAIKMGLHREPTAAELNDPNWRNDPGLMIDALWANGGEGLYKESQKPTGYKPYSPPQLYVKE